MTVTREQAHRISQRLLDPKAEWRSLPPLKKARFLWRMQTDLHPTDPRPEQRQPAGDWLVWLIQSGRGWGKTRTGAETLTEWTDEQPGLEWAVAAPTIRDVRETCIEGPSGLLRSLTDDRVSNYNRSLSEIDLRGGGKIYGLSADEPGRFHGKNLAGAWCDEVALWRYDAAWYEGLIPALRIGTRPRVIVTTTPRPTGLLIDLTTRTDGSVKITRGSTFENRRGLSKVALVELDRRYPPGSRLRQQELEGELLTDVPGAAFTIDMIDHVADFPDLMEVVVAVDPAVTFTPDSDETGIVAVGRAGDHAYILEDDSLTPIQAGSAPGAMQVVADTYSALQADKVVVEANQGQDFVVSALHAIDPTIPVVKINAKHGKYLRAEPVAVLYRQGRVHHVGELRMLEDQMCRWTPDATFSPDRLDALVHGVTAVFPELVTVPHSLSLIR